MSTQTNSLLSSLRQAGIKHPHGTRIRYLAGCHCLRCRAANSRYSCERERARREEADTRDLVSTEPAIAHLKSLSTQGVGSRAAAVAAGISRTVVQQILAGKQTRIRAHHARALLAVSVECAADKAHIDAGPTWKLIDELVERGFAKKQIAEWCGWSEAIQLRHGRITAKSAGRVRRMYELLNQGKLRRAA